MLLEHGEHLGLTAFRSPEPIWSEIIANAATAADKLPEGGKIVDLGSGVGCPCVILQVLRPDTRVYLLESKPRKAKFLRQVVQQLNLPGQVLQDHAEIAAHQPAHRGKFDMVVAKAVASMPVLVELALPLLKLHGRLLAYKGPQAQQGVDRAAAALEALHGRTLSVEPYRLGEKSYCHVLVEKTGPRDTSQAAAQLPALRNSGGATVYGLPLHHCKRNSGRGNPMTDESMLLLDRITGCLVGGALGDAITGCCNGGLPSLAAHPEVPRAKADDRSGWLLHCAGLYAKRGSCTTLKAALKMGPRPYSKGNGARMQSLSPRNWRRYPTPIQRLRKRPQTFASSCGKCLKEKHWTSPFVLERRK